MSTLSKADAKKLLKGSEGEAKFNPKTAIMLIVAVLSAWIGLSLFSGKGPPSQLFAQRPMPEATALPDNVPTVVVFRVDDAPLATATLAPVAVEYPTPIILREQVLEVVTVEVPVVRTEYIEVPGPEIEVTRIVEVAPLALPTVTPVPLAPGTIKICASVEGAKSLYIGNEGVVSGGCKTYTFGMGQTTILVQVDR